MSDLDLADPELAMIINIEENKVCNDCEKKNPRWCSINNAVFLCPSCVRKHRKFNPNVSTIKSIEGDLWSKEEIKKLCLGGNQRFNRLMSYYNIPLTLDNAKYKYHTKIADYYRKLLNEEIKETKIVNIIKPNLKEGIELIDKDDYDKLNQYVPSQENIFQNNNINNINYNSNLNNNINSNLNNNNNNNNFNSNNNFFNSNVINKPYQDDMYANPFGSDFQNNNNNSNQNNYNANNNYNNKSKKDDFDFEKSFNDFTDSMSNVFSNISQKAQSIDYNEKLRNAGDYIMDKKEQIENSDTFKGFMNALTKGFDNFIETADNFLNNNFDDNNQQRRNHNNYDNRNQNQVQFQGQRINNVNRGFTSSSMSMPKKNNNNMNNNMNNNLNNNMNYNINNNINNNFDNNMNNNMNNNINNSINKNINNNMNNNLNKNMNNNMNNNLNINMNNNLNNNMNNNLNNDMNNNLNNNMNNNLNNDINNNNEDLDLDFSAFNNFNNTPMGNNNNNFGNINSIAESEQKDSNNVERLDDDNGENKNN